jgi:hypothetical protein
MIKVTLNKIGKNEPLNLIGSVEILSLIPNTPIVFLIDEMHDDEVIVQNNVNNANELIRNANVNYIGVESHLGGYEWDTEKQDYNYEEYDNSFKLNGSALFTNNFIPEKRNYVYGVECYEIFNKIFIDLRMNKYSDITIHPLNKLRSKHFLKTIIEKWNINQNGNLILNCGRDHNSHIEQWINNGTIDDIAGVKASYIRLNAFD